MSSPLKFLVGIILAFIILGTSLQLKEKLDRSTKLEEFKNDSKKIANIANSFSSQEVGSQKSYKIQVPKDCKIIFDNKSVIAVIKKSHSYNTDLEIIGPTLIFGDYTLILRKKENKVKINIK